MDQIHVLIVEDYDSAAKLAEYMIQSRPAAKITSEIATSLKQTIQRLNDITKKIINVILLDLGLPDAKNFEALQRIHFQFNNIAIILLTGSEELDVIEAKVYGAQACLKKPSDPDTLVNTIREAYETYYVKVNFKSNLTEIIRKIGDIIA